MKWLMSLPLICVCCCLLAPPQLCHAQEQIGLSNQVQHKTKVHNVSLNFDDLPTNKHGIGYHPANPKQSALHYNSVFIQGFSVVDVLKAPLPDISDISCAEHSAPNALFGKVNDGYPWPRISLDDLSKPYHREPDTSQGVVHRPRRTFSLAEIRFKPTGVIPGESGKSFGIVQITLLKLPPDPLEGKVGNGATAADVFPGLLHGTPVWTTRTGAALIVGFLPGTHVPGRLTPKEWFGEDWGRGMDVLEMSGMHYKRSNGTTDQWSKEPWEICVDDVVLEIEVEEQLSGERGEKAEDALRGADARSFGVLDNSEGIYILVKNDGTLAEHTDPTYQQFKKVMSTRTG